MKPISIIVVASILTAVCQIPSRSTTTDSNGRVQEASEEKAAVEWIKTLAKNPKDDAALKGIQGLDPSQFTVFLRLAGETLRPADYCSVSKLIRSAMQESLNASIDALWKDCLAKKEEWQKDESLFAKHTRALLVRANYLADLVVLYSLKSIQARTLWKLSESLAIETDPHPINHYGSLAQIKVSSVFGPETANHRRKLARLCLESLNEAIAKPDWAEKLKECDVEDLKSSFEILAQ